MIARIALFILGLALAGGAAAAEESNSRISIGGTVAITSAVAGPVVAIGGTVDVDAPVGGSFRAAGGSVAIGSGGSVSGDVSVAGGTVTIDGPILGDLHAAGGNVTVNGQVVGNASIAAGTLILGPRARIEGHLSFHGDELRRDPAAQVLGGVGRPHARSHAREHWHWRTHERTLAERFADGWIWSGVLMVLAALIAAALPEVSQRFALELRERPWLTPLLGLVALSAIPVAAVLVMLTIIGIPIGVLALVAYAALLLIGYVWLAVVVGAMLLDRVSPEAAARTASRVGAAVLAMLAFALLVRLPFIGGFLNLAALAVGVGMIVAALFRARPSQAA